MNIEAALTKRLGAAGAKLHTARSRNDQVALDLRLYVKAECFEVRTQLRRLQIALLNFAEEHVDVVMPGYTHLQRAQPITFSHYLLGQIEAFERDAERFAIAWFEQMFSRLVPARSLDRQSFSIANSSLASSILGA